ncbi:MAG: nucleotidyltransferase domain-containing protein [Deltaproteobacteria bacterium]|nr:nucleotidyltransferase domain-containing protein [Deltaproteobacteria bacterium]
MDHQIRNKLISYFATKDEVRLLVVFGSAIDGRMTAESDIDLALDLGRALTIDEKLEISHDLGKFLGRDVDIVDLSKVRGAILEEVVVKGERLMQRSPEDFAKLLTRMWYDKEDDGRFRQRTVEARLARWKQ